MNNYTIYITTYNNSPLAEDAKNCLPNLNVNIFDGTGYPSYSKLINDIILSCKTDIVIILNHKVRPTISHIFKMLDLIYKGYGLVCLQNFHFYGFKKDLIRKIGFFDERFLGGQYEDSDLIRRLIENNIGWYDSTETFVINLPSSWDSSKSKEHFYKKWKNGKLERLLSEEYYDYDLGKYEGSGFLPINYTILSKTNKDYFESINFKFK